MNHRNFTALIVSVIASFAFSNASNAADFPKGSPAFHTSHAAALKAAKESGKPLVIVFSASWCGPCQINKNRVYPSKELQPYHDKFVWAYLDADDAGNVPAMQKAGVSGIPHIEIMDHAQNRIAQSVGMTTPESFASLLEEASKNK